MTHFDYSALVERIRIKYGTQRAFADAMGLTPSVLSSRINGRSEWFTDELRRAADLLGLTGTEANHLFFTTTAEAKRQERIASIDRTADEVMTMPEQEQANFVSDVFRMLDQEHKQMAVISLLTCARYSS